MKFAKLAKKLLGFGIVNREGVRFSNVEKTFMDLVYISRYRSVH